ncbi:hypothetical protein LINGRAHAP2_LOCUS32377 [Linum grandiflorum]
MVQLGKPCRLGGPKSHRPVILPLAREGGDRCSVKPASRITLHSTNLAPPILTKEPKPSSNLGTGRPEIDHLSPTLEASPTSHHFNAFT